MKVTRVEASPIRATVRSDIAIVSSLGMHVDSQYVMVRIETDTGISGLGEASVTAIWSGETQPGTIAVIDHVLAPLLIGVDPFDLAWIDRRMSREAFANSFARSAVECALLDIQGRALGVPLYRLLGGKNSNTDGVRLKFVVGAVEPHLAALRARKMVDAGWTAIKVKVGRDDDPAADLERLRAVRDAIGPDTWLSIDANGAFSVADAIRLARQLESLNVKLFEQPTRRGRHAELRQVRRRSPIPIMADESVFTYDDALDLLRLEAADVLSVYPGKHGGIRPTQEIVRLAEAHGVACTIGSNLEREVATAAMIHTALATPNLCCEQFPGDLIGPIYYAESLTTKPLRYEKDRLFAPDAPGLGVEVR
jgi:muconate cycloisomerase